MRQKVAHYVRACCLAVHSVVDVRFDRVVAQAHSAVAGRKRVVAIAPLVCSDVVTKPFLCKLRECVLSSLHSRALKRCDGRPRTVWRWRRTRWTRRARRLRRRRRRARRRRRRWWGWWKRWRGRRRERWRRRPLSGVSGTRLKGVSGAVVDGDVVHVAPLPGLNNVV